VTITALDHGIEDGASMFTGKQAATAAPLQVVESSSVVEHQRQHAHFVGVVVGACHAVSASFARRCSSTMRRYFSSS